MSCSFISSFLVNGYFVLDNLKMLTFIRSAFLIYNAYLKDIGWEIWNQYKLKVITELSQHAEMLLVPGSRWFWWKKAQVSIWKKIFPILKFVIISFRTWKPKPLGLGNCNVLSFCKTGFKYFCSLFTGT